MVSTPSSLISTCAKVVSLSFLYSWSLAFLSVGGEARKTSIKGSKESVKFNSIDSSISPGVDGFFAGDGLAFLEVAGPDWAGGARFAGRLSSAGLTPSSRSRFFLPDR